MDEDERLEILPDWIDTCLVIGETPHSGNYILVVTKGPAAGRVFEFDHDGYEFIDQADVIEYVEKLLKPDGIKLTDIASHMRFIEDDPMGQWWIRELREWYRMAIVESKELSCIQFLNIKLLCKCNRRQVA